MSRRTPPRPKGQQRHRTRPTVQAAPAPKPVDQPTAPAAGEDLEYFVVAGKRYRWMRSEDGELTAVPAPMPSRLLRMGGPGRLRFQDREGNVTELDTEMPRAVDPGVRRMMEGMVLEKRNEIKLRLDQLHQYLRDEAAK